MGRRLRARIWNLLHRAAQLWWQLRRPRARGASVAVRVGTRVLVVRTSYRPVWDTPGGGLGPFEDPVRGALRELGEETGVVLGPEVLRPLALIIFAQEGRWIEHHLFEAELATKPPLRPARGEIAEIAWLEAEELAGRPLSPVLGWYVARRLSRR